MKEFKEKYNKFQEFLSDRRNRALFTLGLYVLFFIFIAVFFRTRKPIDPQSYNGDNVVTREETGSALDKFRLTANYEYTVKITDGDNVSVVKGKVFRKDAIINLSNVNYYVKDNVYKMYNDKYIKSDIDSLYYLKTTDFYEMINNSQLYFKQEFYDEPARVVSQYKLDYSKYYRESNILKNRNFDFVYIYINELTSEKKINKVTLEFVKGESSVSVVYDYMNENTVHNFTTTFSEDKVTLGE